MAITVRQTTTAKDTTSPYSPGSLGAVPVQGNLLRVTLSERSGGTDATIDGTGWTKQLVLAQSPTNSNTRKLLVVWWKFAGASEPQTVSITGPAGGSVVNFTEYQGDAGEMAAMAFGAGVITGYDTNLSSYSTGTTASVNSTDTFLVGTCYVKKGGTTEAPFSDWVTNGQDDLTQHTAFDDGSYGMDVSWAMGRSTVTGTHEAAATEVATVANDDQGAIAALLVFTIASGGTNASVTPATVSRTVIIAAPTVSAARSATITPATVSRTVAIAAPTVSVVTNATVTPATVSRTVTIAVPTVSAARSATVTPTTVSRTVAIAAPTVAVSSSATVTPATVAGTVSIAAPTVTALVSVTITPATVNRTVSIAKPALGVGGAATNRLLNPSFETDVSNWITTGSDTLERVEGTARDGTAYAVLTSPHTGARWLYTEAKTVTVGQSYSAGIFVKHPTLTNNVRVDVTWHDSDTNIVPTSQSFGATAALTPEWNQRIEENAVAPTGATHGRLRVVFTTVGVNESIHLDAAQFEDSATLPAYNPVASPPTVVTPVTVSGTVAIAAPTITTEAPVTNLIRNPSFETNLNDWINANLNPTRFTGQAGVAPDGDAFVSLAATSTTNGNHTSEWEAISPSTVYSAGNRARHEAGTIRNVRIDIQWSDASKVLISTDIGATTALTTSFAPTVVLNKTSPATAAFARIRFVYLSPQVGDTFAADAYQLEPGATLPAFNPVTPTGDGSTTVSPSTVLGTVSIGIPAVLTPTNILRNPSFEVNLNHWTNSNFNINRVAGQSGNAPDGDAYAVLTSQSATNGNHVSDWEPVSASAPYSAGVRIRHESGTAREVRIDIQWADASQVLISSDLGTLTVPTASFTLYSVLNKTSPATAAYARVRVAQMSEVAGDAFAVDAYQLEPGSTLPAYNPVTPTTGTTLPQVQAFSSQLVHDSYAVCAHPTFRTTVYKHIDLWMQNMKSMGCTVFRGVFNPNNSGVTDAIGLARTHGIKWLMIVVEESTTSPTDQTIATTESRVDYIAANCADICAGIEGLNEPNQNRGDGTTTTGWQNVAYDHQVAIWNRAATHPELANIPIVGPSLHDSKAAANDGEHYQLLADTGIGAYMDWLGLHRYPGGRYPTYLLENRLGYVYSGFGNNFPVWVTETGYHNALDTTSGHLPAPEDVSAAYAPRMLLQFVKRGLVVTRYELLDDPDPAPKDVHESNFGLWRVSDTSVDDTAAWAEKPEVDTMRDFFTALDDPGTTYTPGTVGVEISTAATDIEYMVTAKRDGTATVWIWREQSIWDAVNEVYTPVSAVSVTITDEVGERTFSVDANVQGILLREDTGVTVTPSTVNGYVAIAAPTIAIAVHATITPATVSRTVAIAAPVVSAGAGLTVSPTTVSGTVAIAAPVVSATINVTITPITVSSTVATPVISAGVSVTAAPGTVSRTIVIAAPVVSATVAYPPVPTGLAVTVVSGTQADLTWDNMGTFVYNIERNNSVIVSGHASTSYSDTGLSPETAYTYRVRTVKT